jgi:hypothetical protein
MVGWRLAFAVLALVASTAHAQDRSLCAIVRGNLTTGSELFPYSGSPDPVARALSFTLANFFGGGLEMRYFPPGTHLAFGLSADYLQVRSSVRPAGIPPGVPAEDGFRAIPVEATGYFLLPLSGSTFGVYMGGGVGVYFGRRLYSIAGVEAAAVEHGPGLGIHVLGGVELLLGGGVSLVGEMKFRDVQFRSTTVFPVAQTEYNGVPVALPSQPQVATIHADGVVFQIGLAFAW